MPPNLHRFLCQFIELSHFLPKWTRRHSGSRRRRSVLLVLILGQDVLVEDGLVLILVL